MLSLPTTQAASAEQSTSPGETRIAHWKDDRTAAFLLMFDDSWPSHWMIAVPELVKRDMVATFYINPGKGEYKVYAKRWADIGVQTKMVFGDHTMTHNGVKNLENARWEIGECANIIRTLQPGKANRLVSFAQPGVDPKNWAITNAERDSILKENNLIDRPPFQNHGAVYHKKTLDEMVELADKGIASKGMEYLILHGVERITPDWGYQDFWPLKQAIFLPLLDALKERSDKGDLWVTDHISQHQYAMERDQGSVSIVAVDSKQIRVRLMSKADPELYDYPLTLITRVPTGWIQVEVIQGDQKTVTTALNGVVRYDAKPNAAEIIIRLINR